MVIVKHCPECDKEITKRNLWSHIKEVHKLTNYNTAKAEVLVLRLSVKCMIKKDMLCENIVMLM